jgi:hypothetical protein
MPVLQMFSGIIIDDSRSVIDDYIVMLQLVVSFTIIIYDCHIFIILATELTKRLLEAFIIQTHSL